MNAERGFKLHPGAASDSGKQLSSRLRTRRRAAPCSLRARRSPKPTRARGHLSWAEMNLRVGININWFARLRGTAFQNIVPIFVSRFPSFGRGFDPHRPYQNPNVLKAFSGQLPAYRVPQTLLHNESSLKRIGLAIRIGQADCCGSRHQVRHRAGQRFTIDNAANGSLAPNRCRYASNEPTATQLNHPSDRRVRRRHGSHCERSYTQLEVTNPILQRAQNL